MTRNIVDMNGVLGRLSPQKKEKLQTFQRFLTIRHRTQMDCLGVISARYYFFQFSISTAHSSKTYPTSEATREHYCHNYGSENSDDSQTSFPLTYLGHFSTTTSNFPHTSGQNSRQIPPNILQQFPRKFSKILRQSIPAFRKNHPKNSDLKILPHKTALLFVFDARLCEIELCRFLLATRSRSAPSSAGREVVFIALMSLATSRRRLISGLTPQSTTRS